MSNINVEIMYKHFLNSLYNLGMHELKAGRVSDISKEEFEILITQLSKNGIEELQSGNTMPDPISQIDWLLHINNYKNSDTIEYLLGILDEGIIKSHSIPMS